MVVMRGAMPRIRSTDSVLLSCGGITNGNLFFFLRRMQIRNRSYASHERQQQNRLVRKMWEPDEADYRKAGKDGAGGWWMEHGIDEFWDLTEEEQFNRIFGDEEEEEPVSEQIKARIKVQDGTPRSDEKSLCLRCRNAAIRQGVDLQYKIRCYTFEENVTYAVSKCTAFDDKRQPSLFDMRAVAWNVETRNRGPAGFVPGKNPEDDKANLTVEITPPKKKPAWQGED